MIYRLSKPMRQTVAVLLAVAAFAAAALAIVGPVWARIADLKDSVEQERMVLGRLRSVVGNGASNETLEERAKLLRTSGLVIRGESAPIRQAALQSQLSELSRQSGVKIRSAHALPARDQTGLTLIGTQMQVVAPLSDLQRIIIAIEDQTPALFIESMSMLPSSASGLPNEDRDGMLDARFDVYAVALKQ